MQRQEPRLTVSWDNASIQEVIAGFQAISGRSIILGKNIDAKVTAEIRDKPWPDAFKAILGAYGLSVQEVEGGILRVDAPETLAAIDSLEPRETGGGQDQLRQRRRPGRHRRRASSASAARWWPTPAPTR